jgi:hypothetical protein
MNVQDLLLFGLAVQLSAGAVVMINVVLSGIYESDAPTVTGDRVTPLGQWTDWITAQGRAGKPTETRAA